jgi:hypothetical protein
MPRCIHWWSFYRPSTITNSLAIGSGLSLDTTMQIAYYVVMQSAPTTRQAQAKRQPWETAYWTSDSNGNPYCVECGKGRLLQRTQERPRMLHRTRPLFLPPETMESMERMGPHKFKCLVCLCIDSSARKSLCSSHPRPAAATVHVTGMPPPAQRRICSCRGINADRASYAELQPSILSIDSIVSGGRNNVESIAAPNG